MLKIDSTPTDGSFDGSTEVDPRQNPAFWPTGAVTGDVEAEWYALTYDSQADDAAAQAEAEQSVVSGRPAARAALELARAAQPTFAHPAEPSQYPSNETNYTRPLTAATTFVADVAMRHTVS